MIENSPPPRFINRQGGDFSDGNNDGNISVTVQEDKK